MSTISTKKALAGLVLALALVAPGLSQSSAGQSPRSRESSATKEKRRSDVQLLTRTEQRVDSLRTKLLELQMTEAELQARLVELDYQMTPGAIQRSLAFVGSVRPMDELRDALRARLENEKARVNKQLELVASNRERIQAAINAADAEASRIRAQLSSP